MEKIEVEFFFDHFGWVTAILLICKQQPQTPSTPSVPIRFVQSTFHLSAAHLFHIAHQPSFIAFMGEFKTH